MLQSQKENIFKKKKKPTHPPQEIKPIVAYYQLNPDQERERGKKRKRKDILFCV